MTAATTVEEQAGSAEAELEDVLGRLEAAEEELAESEAVAERAEAIEERMTVQLVSDLALGRLDEAEYEKRRAKVPAEAAEAKSHALLAAQKVPVLTARALELGEEVEAERLAAIAVEDAKHLARERRLQAQLVAVAKERRALDARRSQVRLATEELRERLDPAVRSAREARDREDRRNAFALAREKPARARELAATDPLMREAVDTLDRERVEAERRVRELAVRSWEETYGPGSYPWPQHLERAAAE